MKVGRPPKFKSVKEVEDKIKEYFDGCDKDKRPYTMSGLANALECDRKTLLNYSKKEEFFPTIKAAKLKVHQFVEEQLFYGKATGPIFNLKNNFDWKDRTETEHSGEVGLKRIIIK